MSEAKLSPEQLLELVGAIFLPAWQRHRPSKHRGGGSPRSQRRRADYEAHVARVREQNYRSADYFALHGTKPPRKLRLKWAKEIARDVAA